MGSTAVDHEHRVTPRELVFDLVFVFAFTAGRDAALRRPDVRWDRTRRARAGRALVGVDGHRAAFEIREEVQVALARIPLIGESGTSELRRE